MTAVQDDRSGRATAPGAATATQKKSLVPMVVVTAIVVVAIVVGWRRVTFARTHVTTDNAQIDGHITAVAPRVGAFVDRVLVEENQRVRAGDTLVVLDRRDFVTRLDQATAELRTAEAAIGSRARVGAATAVRRVSEATASSAAASVEAARAALTKAESDLERYRGLAAQKVISAQQLDQAQWAVDNAKAMLQASERQAVAATSQTDVANAGIRIAEARLAGARAAVETATLQLGYTVILAPNDGIIAKRAVEPGALVSVGQALMSVVPESRVWVTANLKETQLEKVAIGSEVEIHVDAYPGFTFRGKVASVSPATGARFALLPPDNATGNFTKVVQRVPVKVELDGPIDDQHPLRPGMSAEVTIKTS